MANFRTINPDDLLLPGKPLAFMLDTTTGTNAYNHAVNAAVAWRISPDLSVMLGFGDKKIGDYKPGQSGLGDLTALGDTVHIGYNANYDISKMTAQDQSTALFKAVWRLNEATELKFSINGYKSEFDWSTAAEADQYYSRKSIDSRTYALDYTYKPGDPLIDFSAKLYLTTTDNNSYYPYRPATNYCPCTSATELSTLGGFARNTSEFSLGSTEITAHYGFEFLKDTTSGKSTEDTGRDNDQRWFNQESPDADRLLASAFVDLSIRPNQWLDIRPGLRYDYFSLKGSGERLYFPDGPMGIYMPYWGDFNVDRSESRLSPSLNIAVEPKEGLQFYGKYVEGFRPPQIQEAMFSGLHIGATSNLIGLWRFFPNTEIMPETSETYELGANASFDSLIRDGDTLRLKASVFHSRVENYMTIAYVALPNQIPNLMTVGGAFVNTLDPATFKGAELEAAYDTGRFYAGLSYTYLDSDLNTSNIDPYIYGGAVPPSGGSTFTGEVFSLAIPPRHKASLDLGGRFFDDRLTLGTRVHYASASKHGGNESQASSAFVPSHTTIDLYGAWKITDLATASLSITNVTDKAHGDPLATGLVLSPGRTATVSLNMRF
ncbi:Heme/hemopexin utilization protein C precursor [Pseudogemmobacter humi]|uniref:Heme/hemopexin utilization protein C n=1 Tax=Pseudogemmobacter humi TaxID=2483812 RepID=A0A3P5XXT4_9RHOB|nr:Heme/hemopexin utilization protein C precursor [Pseudogemmobacter humi]